MTLADKSTRSSPQPPEVGDAQVSQDRGIHSPAVENPGTSASPTGATALLLITGSDDVTTGVETALSGIPKGEYELFRVTTLSEAVAKVEQGKYDAVLLDLAVTGTTAPETLAALGACMPVVILADPAEEAQAYELVQHEGAQAYVLKGLHSPYALAQAVRTAVERKRLEAEVQRQADELDTAHERFAMMVANLEMGLVLFDAEGRLVLVNEAWERRNALSREQVLGRRYDEIGQDDEYLSAQEITDRVLSTGQPHIFHEFFYVSPTHPEGVYLEGSVQPLYAADGTLEGAIAVTADVTDKVRSRQELETQKNLLEAILSETPVGVVLYDPDMRITHLNAEYARISRFDLESARGRILYEIAPDTVSRRAFHQKVLSGDTLDTSNVNYTFAEDAHTTYADVRYRPLRDPEGRITGILSTVVDVTERVVAEQALATHKALLEAIIETAPIGLVYYDREMRIVTMNAEYAQLTRLDPATSIGRTVYELLPVTEPRMDLHQRILAGEVPPVESLSTRRPWDDSERFYDIYYRPVRNPDGDVVGMVSAILDVTDRTELDRQKDEFLSLASHELRTPITSIKGFAQLSLNTVRALGPGHDRLLRHLTTINEQANRLTRLIADLLDVSRLQSGNMPMLMEQVDLGALVTQAVRNAEQTSTGFTFNLTLPSEPLVVEADPHLVEEVVSNLLENAVKYSRENRQIEVSVSREGDEAVTSVRDYGMGIPAGQQGNVFDRFYRASNTGYQARNGLGLGLYIVREIVTRHGGRVWVESTQDVGSTFYFALPLSTPTS